MVLLHSFLARSPGLDNHGTFFFSLAAPEMATIVSRRHKFESIFSPELTTTTERRRKNNNFYSLLGFDRPCFGRMATAGQMSLTKNHPFPPFPIVPLFVCSKPGETTGGSDEAMILCIRLVKDIRMNAQFDNSFAFICSNWLFSFFLSFFLWFFVVGMGRSKIYLFLSVSVARRFILSSHPPTECMWSIIRIGSTLLETDRNEKELVSADWKLRCVTRDPLPYWEWVNPRFSRQDNCNA